MEQTTSFCIFPLSNRTRLITLSKVSVAGTTVEDTTRAPNYRNENSGSCTLQSRAGCKWKLRGQSLWKAVYATALPHLLLLQSAFLPTQLKHRASREARNTYASWDQLTESAVQHGGGTNGHRPAVQTSPLRHAHRLPQRGKDTQRPCRSAYAVGRPEREQTLTERTRRSTPSLLQHCHLS